MEIHSRAKKPTKNKEPTKRQAPRKKPATRSKEAVNEDTRKTHSLSRRVTSNATKPTLMRARKTHYTKQELMKMEVDRPTLIFLRSLEKDPLREKFFNMTVYEMVHHVSLYK